MLKILCLTVLDLSKAFSISSSRQLNLGEHTQWKESLGFGATIGRYN